MSVPVTPGHVGGKVLSFSDPTSASIFALSLHLHMPILLLRILPHDFWTSSVCIQEPNKSLITIKCYGIWLSNTMNGNIELIEVINMGPSGQLGH